MDLDRIIGGPAEGLPLFSPAPDFHAGKPLISTTPTRPRAPLGVRRTTPEIPRARTRTHRPQEDMLFEAPPASVLGHRSERRAPPAGATTEESATPASRIAAALVDGVILSALDATAIYLTLQVCNLAGSEVLQLPAIPLIGFLGLLNGGYFVAFTAMGGQSIGKMALGIKVVSDEDLPVPFGRATLRTLAYVVSALPLGAGFLPGVLGGDRLALHDRLAHTRVVRPASL